MKVAQSCRLFATPVDCTVHGILRVRILEWVAIPFSRDLPTQGSNLGLLHCRWILSQLSHKEGPRILEWVAFPFCSGSSPPRDRTLVSCTAAGFFTEPQEQPPGGTSGKDSACQCRRHKGRRFPPWVGQSPSRRQWQPTPVLLPEKSHGRRSLVGYSPWGHKESDTTEHSAQGRKGRRKGKKQKKCLCLYISVCLLLKYIHTHRNSKKKHISSGHPSFSWWSSG